MRDFGKSRMNGLRLSTSQSPAKGVMTTTNLGNLGAKVTPLKASNNPGPMTAPSAQGPTRAGKSPKFKGVK